VTVRVGLFDSGVGGLSVWREIVSMRPDFETLYVADQAHIPYGAHTASEIRLWSRAIARFLVAQGCDAVVVACNTASAAALETLRRDLPETPFVGMEPAVKPAVETTRRGVVGVLATPATFQGDLFSKSVERFATDVEVMQQVCPGLVECIEAGDLDGVRTQAILRDAITPALAAGADALVLACTHYPFVRPAIEQIAGPDVRILDPAPAIARQLERVLGSFAPGRAPARQQFWTTGNTAEFERIASKLVRLPLRATQLTWSDGALAVPHES